MFRETDVLRTMKSKLYYTAVVGIALCSGIIWENKITQTEIYGDLNLKTLAVSIC